MKASRTRRRLVCLAAPFALVAATPTPASALTHATAVVSGSGVIVPGLTIVPNCVQGAGNNFNFGGDARVTGIVNNAPEVDVHHDVSAYGHDLCGSYASGAGTITVAISGLRPANGVFVRVGSVLLVALDMPTVTMDLGVCAFVPQQTPPAAVTSFSAYCGAVIIRYP